VNRNFVIDPSGKWLYVANQKGDNIVQFEINPETGARGDSVPHAGLGGSKHQHAAV
jgi:6-phosphogluconolactonase (cycloisomerase 2 family)